MNPDIKNRILIQFAHPAIYKSRVNKKLIEHVKDLEGVTCRDLYEIYPDFYIDVKKEQELLLEHEIIILHHPFYWYSCPSILKEWQDLVLEFGFSYGPGGDKLKGKCLMNVLTAGGSKEAYTQDGQNRHTIREFLLPFEQTAILNGMNYLPPLVIHDSINVDINIEFHHYTELYRKMLEMLRDGKIEFDKVIDFEYINDYYVDRK